MERSEYKQALVVGLVFIFLIALGGIQNSLSIFLVNIGIFLVVVSIGGLLAKQDINQKSADLYFYGFLLIGAGSAFLIDSQIAWYGITIFSWIHGSPMVYFKTPNWWIFLVSGAALIVVGVILVIWSWHYRKNIDILN
ncbi:MAG: hypothetical protein ACFFDQ_08085 [Candidatus Thorarchaeota archaeon]